jgi:diadenosine tetraphosphate (Ap4A) HIT family hydrolase
MTYDTNNIFARIIRGEIPCNKVYDDAHVLAFNDIHPQAPTHILVIPKGTYVSMSDFSQKASAAEQAAFFAAIGKIVAEKKLDDAGYRVIANAGVHGGQEVPHFHIHILAGKRLGRMLPEAA